MGFRIDQYTESHLRVFGPTVVDYWPGTGSCWLTDTMHKSQKMEPAEVLALASTPNLLPEGASDHLKDIKRVSEGEVP